MSGVSAYACGVGVSGGPCHPFRLPLHHLIVPPLARVFHRRCCTLQVAACDALINLASDNGGVQAGLATGRGVGLLNKALDIHGSDPALCEAALTALAATTDELDVCSPMAVWGLGTLMCVSTPLLVHVCAHASERMSPCASCGVCAVWCGFRGSLSVRTSLTKPDRVHQPAHASCTPSRPHPFQPCAPRSTKRRWWRRVSCGVC